MCNEHSLFQRYRKCLVYDDSSNGGVTDAFAEICGRFITPPGEQQCATVQDHWQDDTLFGILITVVTDDFVREL